jgi:hypothetical protein
MLCYFGDPSSEIVKSGCNGMGTPQGHSCLGSEVEQQGMTPYHYVHKAKINCSKNNRLASWPTTAALTTLKLERLLCQLDIYSWPEAECT